MLAAIDLILIVVLGMYAGIRNHDLARESREYGTFTHPIPPAFVMIDTTHPDCPEWLAAEYRALLRFSSLLFVFLLFLLFVIDKAADLFPSVLGKGL